MCAGLNDQSPTSYSLIKRTHSYLFLSLSLPRVADRGHCEHPPQGAAPECFQERRGDEASSSAPRSEYAFFSQQRAQRPGPLKGHGTKKVETPRQVRGRLKLRLKGKGPPPPPSNTFGIGWRSAVVRHFIFACSISFPLMFCLDSAPSAPHGTKIVRSPPIGKRSMSWRKGGSGYVMIGSGWIRKRSHPSGQIRKLSNPNR